MTLAKHNVNTCDEKGNSLLIWESYNRNQKMCEALLSEEAMVDMPSNTGLTALYGAAFRGHVEVFTLLLKNKAHVNQKMAMAGACTLLPQNNGHVNQQQKDGASLLFITAKNGHVHICNLLLENNAHVDQRMKNGTSP